MMIKQSVNLVQSKSCSVCHATFANFWYFYKTVQCILIRKNYVQSHSNVQ